MNLPADLAEALLAAPLGVATLARLEWRAVDGGMCGGEAPAPTPAGVDAAVAVVGSMTFPELIELVLWAETTDVGPWIGDASQRAASAYRHAEVRRPIAEAVAERFGGRLYQPLDRSVQQFWTTAVDPSATLRLDGAGAPRLGDFDEGYGAGQVTFGGLWTVTDPPAALHEGLADVWEMFPGSIVRWRLPVRPDARVFEIHCPDDWVRLVAAHPTPAAPGQQGWELPGPTETRALSESASSTDYQSDTDEGWFGYSPNAEPTWSAAGGRAPHPEGSVRSLPVDLLEVPGQHAVRMSIGRHLVPDWASVAREWDGVHLSWAGLVTTEGFVSDLPDADVAMLRYWFSERTLWLADVFGEPEPLGAAEIEAELSDGASRPGAIDLRTDTAAHERERRRLGWLLGR